MNRVALVTGATGGMGKEIVKALYNHNYDLITIGRNEKKFQEFLISENYDKNHISFYKCDITKLAQLEILKQTICKNYKQIDVLINCAGG